MMRSTSSDRDKYDVFVSFRREEEDTSHSFIDHLFDALQSRGIVAFWDDTKINKSESIPSDAIKDSQVFIVVLSKNYASSTWCLQELEYILECSQQYGKRVLPVFYDVDPSEVRHQKGSYGEALVKHEKVFGYISEKVRLWREALTQVANLSGWFVRDNISDESKIEMHGLLEVLGKTIVHENSRKWSRLWLHEQFYNVVSKNMEINVEAVVLYGPGSEKGILIAEALSKMNQLRLLIFKEVKFPGSLNYISNKLRYVEWDGYPFMYLPSSIQLDELCELILVDSSITQLWTGRKYLPNLRTLDLSCSKNLVMMPHFVDFPKLKRLNLEGCVRLVEINSSIGLLKELVFLNLKNCKNLICIPNEISGLISLKYFNFYGCSKAFNSDKAHSCLLPSLPSVSCLSELDISFCCLSKIPDALGCLPWLERLNLRGNNFVTLPSLRDRSRLEYLNLEHCKQLTSLPELPLLAAIKKDKHKRAGMFIFNCPELGEREQCSNMTLSWMLHFIQANQYSSASFHQIDIVIPGSEIPRWFNNRRMGRSISIDPSPIVYDDNIIGIACCAVFSVELFDPTKTKYEWGPVIRFGFTSSNAANNNYVVIPVTLYRHLITVKSNHMWLIYFDRELFFSSVSSIDNTLWELDHIKMEASTTNGQGLHLDIKNCGYRWVFKQDQQPFDSLNNDALRKEERHKFRPANLLAIEDEAQPQSQAQ